MNDTANGSRVVIRVDQAGGKYGKFECPFCGCEALYKFSAGVGSCPACEATFICTTESVSVVIGNNPLNSSHVMELYVEKME